MLITDPTGSGTNNVLDPRHFGMDPDPRIRTDE
jgi:hypothetical protein